MTVYWGVKSRSKGTTSPAVLSKGVLDITSVVAKFRRRAATAPGGNREAPTLYRRRNQSCSKRRGCAKYRTWERCTRAASRFSTAGHGWCSTVCVPMYH